MQRRDFGKALIGTGTAPCASTGCTSNEILNTPASRPDVYSTVEFAVTRRGSKRWNAATSFWMTKDHRWINGLANLAGSPNDNSYPIDDTWNWEARGNFTYNLPKGFRLSSFFRAQSGAWGQRTEVFTGTGINGQTLNQGSVTMKMGPFGQYRGRGFEC
jgi:hypothetical protein